MRFTGHLQQWNEQRGFGFIRPAEGGDDVFVHVSALPSPPPAPHELLSFEVALDGQGRKKAMHVRRVAQEAAALAADRSRQAPGGGGHSAHARPPRRAARGLAPTLLSVLVVAGLAWAGYDRLVEGRVQPRQAVTSTATPVDRATSSAFTSTAAAVPRATTSAFTCDGRTRCSQMRSCEEATFFLRNCPHTEMDGDHDGVPCEQQWCTSSWR